MKARKWAAKGEQCLKRANNRATIELQETELFTNAIKEKRNESRKRPRIKPKTAHVVAPTNPQSMLNCKNDLFLPRPNIHLRLHLLSQCTAVQCAHQFIPLVRPILYILYIYISVQSRLEFCFNVFIYIYWTRPEIKFIHWFLVLLLADENYLVIVYDDVRARPYNFE